MAGLILKAKSIRDRNINKRESDIDLRIDEEASQQRQLEKSERDFNRQEGKKNEIHQQELIQDTYDRMYANAAAEAEKRNLQFAAQPQMLPPSQLSAAIIAKFVEAMKTLDLIQDQVKKEQHFHTAVTGAVEEAKPLSVYAQLPVFRTIHAESENRGMIVPLRQNRDFMDGIIQLAGNFRDLQNRGLAKVIMSENGRDYNVLFSALHVDIAFQGPMKEVVSQMFMNLLLGNQPEFQAMPNFAM